MIFQKAVKRFLIWQDQKNVARMGLLHLPGSPYQIVRYHIVAYPGETFTLPDGSLIEHGAPALEVHLDNTAILTGMAGSIKITSEAQIPALFHKELVFFAAVVQNDWVNENVVGMFSMSMLGPLLRRIGFKSVPFKMTLALRMQIIWMRLLFKAFSKPTKKRRGKKRRDKLEMLWVSRKALMEMDTSSLYGERSGV